MATDSFSTANLSFDDLTAMIGDDLEALQEIVNSYLEDAPRLLEEIQVGWQNDDLELIQRSAHTLKSSSRLFRADEFARQCQALEDYARNGDIDSLAPLIPVSCEFYQAIAATLSHKLTELKTL